MNKEQQLKLQAFFDGELPEAESREVAAWLARDAEATALLAELRNTRKALADFEPALRLPESREFYWSKIQREIERREPVAETKSSVPFWTWLRRVIVPAGATAAVAIAGFLAFMQFTNPKNANGVKMATMLADAALVSYRDHSEGMTVVWLSYPSENEFTPATSGDTIP